MNIYMVSLLHRATIN